MKLRSVRRVAVCCLAATASLLHAQHARPDFETAGRPLAVAPADPQIAAALHAVSPAEMRKTIEALVSFRNRNTVGSTETLPEGVGVTAAAAWIKARFEAISQECNGCLEVKEDRFVEPAQTIAAPRIKKPTPLINVYAVMKGTDPAQADRRMLVSGHYDSFFVRDMQNVTDPAPGANDDASGTAVSLECARVLSKHKFPATIVFVAVAGEEQGLVGSTHLAKLARSEGWNIEGVLNNDIVGGDTTPADLGNEDKDRVRVFSEGISLAATPEQVKRILAVGQESDSNSRELARAIADAGRTYTEPAKAAGAPLRPVLVMRLDRFLRGGDHSSFNREGFTGVRFTEWRENFDHQHQVVRVENGVQYGDLIQFDDFNYMAKVARLNAATLATLASAPAPPEKVVVLTRNLDNNSLLTWAEPATAAKYEVLWRETEAADWQYSADAAKFSPVTKDGTTTVTVPVSKDNVIFGVRACDAAEHCSPAVSPMPGR